MSRRSDDFEAWVRARTGVLTRTAYLLTGDTHLAEDLLQDTLVRVARHWPRVSREGAPDAYARQVMHHLVVDRWRRRRRRPVEVLTAERPELAAGSTQDVERRLVLRDALAALTPKQRATVSLRFYEDLTEVQTAEVLGCSVSTVKSTTRDALARLRRSSPHLLAELSLERP